MKKLLLTIMGFMIAATLSAGPVFAAEPAKDAGKTGTEKTEKAEKGKVTGKVKSIDPAKGELIVTPEGGGEDMTFKIKKTQAKNVKADDNVTVHYEKKENEMKATRVTKKK